MFSFKKYIAKNTEDDFTRVNSDKIRNIDYGYSVTSHSVSILPHSITCFCYDTFGSLHASIVKKNARVGVVVIPEEKQKECETCGSRKFIDDICIYCGNTR